MNIKSLFKKGYKYTINKEKRKIPFYGAYLGEDVVNNMPNMVRLSND